VARVLATHKRDQIVAGPPSPALGGLQIPRWLGSDPLSAWWLGLAPATLEFWVRFPNERNQGKQAHPVLKYRVPPPHADNFVIGPAVIKHTPKTDPLFLGFGIPNRSPDPLVQRAGRGKTGAPFNSELKHRVPHGSHPFPRVHQRVMVKLVHTSLGSSYRKAHVKRDL
jgi:hypothetical protein